MAGQVKINPTFALTPSAERTPTTENYITNLSVMEIEQSLHSYVW